MLKNFKVWEGDRENVEVLEGLNLKGWMPKSNESILLGVLS